MVLYSLWAFLGADFFLHKHLSFGEHYTDTNHNHRYDAGEHYHDHNGNGQYDRAMFEGESWFGFYSVYGLVSCVVLVLLATELRKVLSARRTTMTSSALHPCLILLVEGHLPLLRGRWLQLVT